MSGVKEKCVIVIDAALPMGLIANTAAILGITLGQRRPDVVGDDVADGEGRWHPGIIRIPVPVLGGTRERMREIRQALDQPEYSDVTVVEFTELAQSCRTYEEYIGKMGQVSEDELRYTGFALCGTAKKVAHLTGSIPLLR